jgi:hypothetical protein
MPRDATHFAADAVSSFARAVREHGQGEDFERDALRDREISQAVLQRGIGLLQMQGNRVVNPVPMPAFFK